MRVHDRPRVLGTAHRRRRGWVPVGSQVRGDRVCELVVPDCVAGHDLELDELSERRIAGDLAGQPHPFEHPARVPVIEGLVLKVLPDRQVGHDADPELREISRRADARPQQDRRTPV